MKKIITSLLILMSTSTLAATNEQCMKANNNIINFSMLYKSIFDNALGSREEKLSNTSVTFNEYKKWTENKFNYDIKELMINSSQNNDFSYPVALTYTYLPKIVAAHSYIYSYLETKDTTYTDKLKSLNVELATMYKTLKKECPQSK